MLTTDETAHTILKAIRKPLNFNFCIENRISTKDEQIKT